VRRHTMKTFFQERQSQSSYKNATLLLLYEIMLSQFVTIYLGGFFFTENAGQVDRSYHNP